MTNYMIVYILYCSFYLGYSSVLSYTIQYLSKRKTRIIIMFHSCLFDFAFLSLSAINSCKMYYLTHNGICYVHFHTHTLSLSLLHDPPAYTTLILIVFSARKLEPMYVNLNAASFQDLFSVVEWLSWDSISMLETWYILLLFHYCWH